MITTESVLLNPNRNPGLTREHVEELLLAYLGIEKVIWLRDGLVEDRDTDGHSDNITQFVRPGVVLAQMAPDRSNPNWDASATTARGSQEETDAAGRKLEVVEMPVLPYVEVDGERSSCRTPTTTPSTAASSRRCSASPTTRRASRCCASCSPTARSWALPSRLLAYGGGGIGCITQQLPAGMALAP